MMISKAGTSDSSNAHIWLFTGLLGLSSVPCIFIQPISYLTTGLGYHSSDMLKHGPYLRTLPSPDKLRTPLHFTDPELASFRGSNLFGATLDRKGQWEGEWQQCKATVASANTAWGTEFTWSLFLIPSSPKYRLG